MNTVPDSRRPWVLCGSGAVASAFAARIALLGHPVLVLARDVAAARLLARRAGPSVAVGPRLIADARPNPELSAALQGARALVIAVSDTELDNVAQLLACADDAGAEAARERPEGRVALHTSGSQGRDALAPLAASGWSTGSLHPLAALAPRGDGAALVSAWFALEGDERALATARELVSTLRGDGADVRGPDRPTTAAAPSGGELFVGAENDPERLFYSDAKLLYHSAASLVSIAVVAVLELAEGCLVHAGVAPDAARAALAALAASAVENVRTQGPAAALTGPAVRGDIQLVALHVAALRHFDAVDSERLGGFVRLNLDPPGVKKPWIPPGASEIYRALLPTLARLVDSRPGTGDLGGSLNAISRNHEGDEWPGLSSSR